MEYRRRFYLDLPIAHTPYAQFNWSYYKSYIDISDCAVVAWRRPNVRKDILCVAVGMAEGGAKRIALRHTHGGRVSHMCRRRHLVAIYNGGRFNIENSTFKIRTRCLSDTYVLFAYRGYDSDDALRAVGVIPTATHKMPFRH